jgi:hypothetical protein
MIRSLITFILFSCIACASQQSVENSSGIDSEKKGGRLSHCINGSCVVADCPSEELDDSCQYHGDLKLKNEMIKSYRHHGSDSRLWILGDGIKGHERLARHCGLNPPNPKIICYKGREKKPKPKGSKIVEWSEWTESQRTPEGKDDVMHYQIYVLQ